MITKEDEQEIYRALDEYHSDQKEKWNKAKQELSGLIHPKYFDFAEDHDTFFSEGICEIEETEEKNSDHPNRKYCRIKGGSSLKYGYTTNTIECCNIETQYEGEPVEYWVYQVTGHLGDDYTGELLLPLLDGKRYWRIGYSC